MCNPKNVGERPVYLSDYGQPPLPLRCVSDDIVLTMYKRIREFSHELMRINRTELFPVESLRNIANSATYVDGELSSYLYEIRPALALLDERERHVVGTFALVDRGGRRGYHEASRLVPVKYLPHIRDILEGETFKKAAKSAGVGVAKMRRLYRQVLAETLWGGEADFFDHGGAAHKLRRHAAYIIERIEYAREGLFVGDEFKEHKPFDGVYVHNDWSEQRPYAGQMNEHD
jgi:hypothetical protein